MFTVVWLDAATEQLAEIGSRSDRRDEIREAVREIDRILAAAAGSAGESRSGEHRVSFAGPLSIAFRVGADDRRVLVTAVKSMRRDR